MCSFCFLVHSLIKSLMSWEAHEYCLILMVWNAVYTGHDRQHKILLSRSPGINWPVRTSDWDPSKWAYGSSQYRARIPCSRISSAGPTFALSALSECRLGLAGLPKGYMPQIHWDAMYLLQQFQSPSRCPSARQFALSLKNLHRWEWRSPLISLYSGQLKSFCHLRGSSCPEPCNLK